MTERVIGRIGNLSETGMLLIASEALADDALYQLRFTLHDGTWPRSTWARAPAGATARAPRPSLGGFRFIAVSEAQARRLRARIEAPGSHYE